MEDIGGQSVHASFSIHTQMCGETEDDFVERLFVGLGHYVTDAPTSTLPMAAPTVDGGGVRAADAVAAEAVVRVDGDVDANEANGAAERTMFTGAAGGRRRHSTRRGPIIA